LVAVYKNSLGLLSARHSPEHFVEFHIDRQTHKNGIAATKMMMFTSIFAPLMFQQLPTFDTASVGE
jgi:hypothetical protein